MRAPGFWWRSPPGPVAQLLRPLGRFYGATTLRRMRSQGAQAGIPVICVGNFVAGGAGKTPTALMLAGLLRMRGETPFVLMRGYGGSLPGPVAVDPARHGPGEVGDEAILMAAHARTVVSRDRPAGAALAKKLGASVIVMDDGLQNPSLAKTLRLAVVDGASGVGNGLCIPAGPLRAPLAGQLAATDAVLVIGEGQAGKTVAGVARSAGVAVLRGRLAPASGALAKLRGQPVIAVSGIGRPEKFLTTLRDAGAIVLVERSFGDHHAYTAGEVIALVADAREKICIVATTEKDMTKLGPLWPEAQRHLLLPVPVTLVMDRPEDIAALLERALAGSGAAGAAQP
jgi:tetraacyldisaccharide 4'-kinase